MVQTYGSIVYTARSLYWDMYNDMSIFTDICPTEYSVIRKMQHNTNYVELDTVQAYSLFPNPNNGMLILTQNHADNKPVTISVTTIVGATLAVAQPVTFVNRQYKLQLPANTKSGMYLLQIKDSGNHFYNLKFVVE